MDAYKKVEQGLEAVLKKADLYGIDEAGLREINEKRLCLALAQASPEIIEQTKAEYIRQYGINAEVINLLDTALATKGALEV